MYRDRSIFLCRLFLIASTILPISCFKDLVTNKTLYENDFQGSQLKGLELTGWNNNVFSIVDGLRISDFNGNKVLGKLNNNQVRLIWGNLAWHQAVRIDLVLNIHNTWKNDVWAIALDGNAQLVTGFSNDPAIQQSYPNWRNGVSPFGPAGGNSTTTALPGVCSMISNPRGSSQYHIVTTFHHEGPSLEFICNDTGGPVNDTCQRSWSLSYLKISILKN